MISVQQIFSFSLWFGHHQYQDIAIYILFSISFFLILLGILFTLKSRRLKKRKVAEYNLVVTNKLVNFFYYAGFILLFFSFAASQSIKIFSLRFWYVIWFMIFAYYAYTIIKFKRVEFPRRKEASLKREEKNKYLPKKKKENRKNYKR